MPTSSQDVFIHSGLVSNPKNWSQGALPGPNSVPPNTGIFNQGTMTMAGAPEKLDLEVFGTPTLIMNGHGQNAKVSIVNGGLNVVSTGNNSLSINEGGVPGPYSNNDISFSGTLHLSGSYLSSSTDVTGSGDLKAHVSVSGNTRPDGGGPATLEIGASVDPTSTFDVTYGGTLIFDRLHFIRTAENVTLNDGWPNGVPPGAPSPVTLNEGAVPTLEIEHLAPLAGVTLTADDLTLNFAGGQSVSLHNVSADNPQYYQAWQEPNGTFLLSEGGPPTTNLPAGTHSIPVATA